MDITASLMRPLIYKRHTGKLKPFEKLSPGIGVKRLKTAPIESRQFYQYFTSTALRNLYQEKKEERKKSRKITNDFCNNVKFLYDALRTDLLILS